MSEYPRMLYHEDGRTLTVQNEEQERGASDFGRDPHPVHRSEGTNAPNQVRSSPAGMDDLALHVADTVIARLLERFDLVPIDDGAPSPDEIAKPRRGRPRKVLPAEPETAAEEA